jgi:hypothetical protein
MKSETFMFYSKVFLAKINPFLFLKTKVIAVTRQQLHKII